jgi:hypothetical protein
LCRSFDHRLGIFQHQLHLIGIEPLGTAAILHTLKLPQPMPKLIVLFPQPPALRACRIELAGQAVHRAAELVETAVEETLTYYAFPEEHWRRIRTKTRSSASCARSGGARVSSARSLTVNPRST